MNSTQPQTTEAPPRQSHLYHRVYRGITDYPFSILTGKSTYGDLAAIAILFVLAVIAEWHQIIGGISIGLDSATQFYPRFMYLGESLRSGYLPGWLPAQFSGSPFAADPQSGWMYFPAMFLFTFLPAAVGAKGYLFLHLFLAATGAYALGRVLGMNRPGSLLAAIGYGYNSFIYERDVCCFTYTGVMTWLPFAILAADLALGSRSLPSRVAWCAVSGLAISQMLGMWLGQGAYYGLLAVGSYLLFRALFSPPSHFRDIRISILALLLTGAIIVLFAFGVAAAGILPRLQFNELSILSGGYQGTQQAVTSGWKAVDWRHLVDRGARGNFYASGAILALAIIAPFAARARYRTIYWTLLALGTLVLSLQQVTPLHWLLYRVLPGFASLHPHDPERIMMLFYLAVSMMAGASLSSLMRFGPRAVYLAIIPSVPLIAILGYEGYLTHSSVPILPTASLLLALVAIVYVVAHSAFHQNRRVRSILTSVMVFAVFFDLLAAGEDVLAIGPGHEQQVNFDQYYSAGTVARFLRLQPGVFRFFGYDTALQTRDIQAPHQPVLYRYQFASPEAQSLIVNNRATVLGLQDIQGYNATQLQIYANLFNSINGYSFDYRSLYVLDSGLRSPILNLLNVRYIVVPASFRPDRTDLQWLVSHYRTVMNDGTVRVLQNTDALPRAWIVNTVRTQTDNQTLRMLSAGKIDPARVALVSPGQKDRATLTSLRNTNPTSSVGTAQISRYRADNVRIETQTSMKSMLIMSEMYYPSWKAYVDGKQVPVYRVDYALRGVVVPRGNHTVEMRFQSMPLRTGLTISAISLVALIASISIALVYHRRRTMPTE